MDKNILMYRDEGIVLKDLGSKWEPSDRSGKWLKLKPEYIRAGSDLDVLIIGLYSLFLVSNSDALKAIYWQVLNILDFM